MGQTNAQLRVNVVQIMNYQILIYDKIFRFSCISPQEAQNRSKDIIADSIVEYVKKRDFTSIIEKLDNILKGE